MNSGHETHVDISFFRVRIRTVPSYMPSSSDSVSNHLRRIRWRGRPCYWSSINDQGREGYYPGLRTGWNFAVVVPLRGASNRLRPSADGTKDGYCRIRVLLQREGWPTNHNRIWRLYSQAGVSMRKRKRNAPRCRARGSAHADRPEPGLVNGPRLSRSG